MSTVPPIIANVEGELVAPELRPLLLRLHAATVGPVSSLPEATAALRALLEFLATPVGRTNANCWAVDLFCMADAGWRDERWDHLPEALADILADMAGALHDTVQDPETARNFESTPEQLLDRLQQFELRREPA